jgi:hypothetical protein
MSNMSLLNRILIHGCEPSFSMTQQELIDTEAEIVAIGYEFRNWFSEDTQRLQMNINLAIDLSRKLTTSLSLLKKISELGLTKVLLDKLFVPIVRNLYWRYRSSSNRSKLGLELCLQLLKWISLDLKFVDSEYEKLVNLLLSINYCRVFPSSKDLQSKISSLGYFKKEPRLWTVSAYDHYFRI